MAILELLADLELPVIPSPGKLRIPRFAASQMHLAGSEPSKEAVLVMH